ncbi:MAG: DUF624 domain-containing protein [Oenococcus sp.]|uniref:DUF624 domain-containing protein n=2 Tax=Lactobacillaceae TaxID=33958 RepID=UPI0021E8EC38|nr:DUF624 domain-containing protein [Oenococcus kitaharae]MCV3295622.1 DUF624 domain-containing protein [Oenococcus kitaharae]
MNWVKLSKTIINIVSPILFLSAVWWLLNFPYALLAVMIFTAKNSTMVQTAVASGLLFMPISAIPATVTTLALARRYFKDGHHLPSWKTELFYYRRDYLKSLIFGLINLSLLIIFYVSARYYARFFAFLAVIFIVLLVLLPFFFMILYSFLVDQQLSYRAYAANSFFMLVAHPVNSLLMMIDVAGTAFLLWVTFPPLLPILFPGSCVLLVTHYFKKSLDKEISKRADDTQQIQTK